MSRQDFSYPVDQPFDPYQPPESVPENPRRFRPSPAGRDAIPFSLNNVMGRTWALYRERMGLCVGTYAASFLLSIAGQSGIPIVGGLIGAATQDPTARAIMGVATQVVLMVYGVWLGIGQTSIYLKIAQRRPTSVGEIFAGGRYLIPVVVAAAGFGLLGTTAGLIGALPGILIMAAAGPEAPLARPIIVLGMIAAVSAIFLRCSQFLFVILDRPGVSGLEALRESGRITRGQVWRIVTIFAAAWFAIILGILALIVGAIFTLPFAFLTFAVMYTMLKSRSPN